MGMGSLNLWIGILFHYHIVLNYAAASITTLSYADDGCTSKMFTHPGQSYRWIYNGEKLYGICDTIAFEGWDKDHKYEVCLQVEEFDVRCGYGVMFDYRSGEKYDKYLPGKAYDCTGRKSDIPRFCASSDNLLFVTITAPGKSNSIIAFNVTSGQQADGIGIKTYLILRWVGCAVGIIIAVPLVYIAIRKCIRKRREKKERTERIKRVEREVYGPNYNPKEDLRTPATELQCNYSKVSET